MEDLPSPLEALIGGLILMSLAFFLIWITIEAGTSMADCERPIPLLTAHPATNHYYQCADGRVISTSAKGL